VRITSSGICGSDLHLYEVLGPFLTEGDILGHEPMGIAQEVGGEVAAVRPGDRVVIPFNVSCGTCFMCTRGLRSQCETTQVREHDEPRALDGEHEAGRRLLLPPLGLRAAGVPIRFPPALRSKRCPASSRRRRR